MTTTHNSILEEALRLAALGYPVFPLRPGGKRPLTAHGFKDATTVEAQIRAWWSQYPDANIGIVTGKGSGLVVLDIDPRHGGDEALAALEASHGAIHRTVMARTGGQGRHIYFRAPEDGLRNSAGRLGKGLDVRGDGGYIVAPPSVHASGNAYAWEPGRELGEGVLPDVPGWMLLAAAGPLSRTTRETQAARNSEPTQDGGAGLRIFEGQRHSNLVSIAGGLRRRGMSPKAIGGALSEINRTSCEPPLPADEIERIATSMVAYQPANSVRSRSFSSACEVLRDPQYSKLVGGTLEFDEFAEAPTISRRLITDQDIDRIRDAIERTITFVDKKGLERGIQFSHDEMGRAVHLVARERPFHPVRDYLKRLTWDGVPRLSTLLPAWLRLGTDPLAAILVRRWMISAVARPFRPGCKVDAVFVLVGGQGTRKSTFFLVLASDEWFSDTPVNVGDKDAFLALRRVWIMEFAELEAMARARDANQVKSFLSSTTDKFRPPYGREVIEVPRTCVIAASTNEEAFLSDPTGNRRYWTVKVQGVIDIDAIAANRDQLWAEAVAAFNAGEPWHLAPDEDALLGKIQRAFEAADPWEDAVLAQAIRASNGISIANLLGGALEKKTGFWTRNDEMRVAAILRRAGFKRKSLHRQRLWFPPGDSAATAATSSMKPTDYEYFFSDDASVAPDAAVAVLAPKAEE